MHIVLLIATRRGCLVLEKAIDLAPDAELTAFSFREDPWEPPFLEDIQSLTLAHDGTFIESRQVGSAANAAFWASSQVDIMFAVNWRYMIPPVVYQRPRLGTYIFHDSLLPAYRGFSPTVWAMINGEDQTGVTLFEITEEVDSGDIVGQEAVPIGLDETIAEVSERVTQANLQLFERHLPGLLDGSATRTPQDHSLATYTCKRVLDDNQIDWEASTRDIFNLIRALSHPYPGAYTYFSGDKLRVWSAERIDFPAYIGRIPGRVVGIQAEGGVVVLTGDGAVVLKTVQIEDGDIQTAAEVITRLSQTLGS
jgi:methionyl-tRNA formyltransferase